MPRIDSGSWGEIHLDARPRCEPDQSEPSDEESCEEGWQAVEGALTLQRVSSRAEIGECRSRRKRITHPCVSKKWLRATWSWLERDCQQRRKTSLMRLCCKGREIMTAWRSLAQGLVQHDTPESGEDWVEHFKKRYEYGTDGKEDHRPAGTTRARAGRRRPRSEKSVDEWSTSR